MTNEKMELDLDTLSGVAGGEAPEPGPGAVDGTVVALLPNMGFSVDVGGQTVTAHIPESMRLRYPRTFIRIRVGERVRVEGNQITWVYR